MGIEWKESSRAKKINVIYLDWGGVYTSMYINENSLIFFILKICAFHKMEILPHDEMNSSKIEACGIHDLFFNCTSFILSAEERKEK